LVPKYFLVGLIGAVIAGLYGVVHDQLTYSLSPEYFTRFKFHQFHYADPGLESPRVFVAVIGFLATWWVGLISGWMLARFAVLEDGEMLPICLIIKHFFVILATAILAGTLGWGWGLWRSSTGYAANWLSWMDDLQIHDRVAFMKVGYIHNFGYSGALLGLLFAILLLYRSKCRWLSATRRR